MGKTHTNAVEMSLHGDSIEVFIIEDLEFIGTVRAIVRVTTDKDGNIKVYTVSASCNPILIEQKEL